MNVPVPVKFGDSSSKVFEIYSSEAVVAAFSTVLKRNANVFSLNAVVDVGLRRLLIVLISRKLIKLATSKINTAEHSIITLHYYEFLEWPNVLRLLGPLVLITAGHLGDCLPSHLSGWYS